MVLVGLLSIVPEVMTAVRLFISLVVCTQLVVRELL